MTTQVNDLSPYDDRLREDLLCFLEKAFYVLNPGSVYLPNWHIEVIADALEKCRRGEIKRLVINVPPRSLKSHCAIVAFVAFLMGHDPSAKVICASYAQDLSDKHSMDCRSLMTDEFYQRIFPTRISRQKNSAAEFTTIQKGFRLATSVGGTLTGRGGDYLIIDDPHKPDEALSDTRRGTANDWFDHTVRSRLNSQEDGRIIVIMQRLHEDDLAGRLIEQGGWTVLSLPAIAEEDESYTISNDIGEETFTRKAGEALHPDRQSLGSLTACRKEVGEYHFASQYQQRPAPLGGGLVKIEWFRTYTLSERPIRFDMVVQSWDTANKATDLSDYSVCTTWGILKDDMFLLDVYRARLEYPALKRMVRALAEQFRPKTIIIEDKASGTQLLQELKQEGLHEVTGYQSTLDKILRMSSASSSIENGRVYLPHDADWLRAFLHEVSSFPKGRNDDQVDSMSQAIDWIKTKRWGRNRGLFEFYQMLLTKNDPPSTSIFEQGA